MMANTVLFAVLMFVAAAEASIMQQPTEVDMMVRDHMMKKKKMPSFSMKNQEMMKKMKKSAKSQRGRLLEEDSTDTATTTAADSGPKFKELSANATVAVTFAEAPDADAVATHMNAEESIASVCAAQAEAYGVQKEQVHYGEKTAPFSAAAPAADDSTDGDSNDGSTRRLRSRMTRKLEANGNGLDITYTYYVVVNADNAETVKAEVVKEASMTAIGAEVKAVLAKNADLPAADTVSMTQGDVAEADKELSTEEEKAKYGFNADGSRKDSSTETTTTTAAAAVEEEEEEEEETTTTTSTTTAADDAETSGATGFSAASVMLVLGVASSLRLF